MCIVSHCRCTNKVDELNIQSTTGMLYSCCCVDNVCHVVCRGMLQSYSYFDRCLMLCCACPLFVMAAKPLHTCNTLTVFNGINEHVRLPIDALGRLQSLHLVSWYCRWRCSRTGSRCSCSAAAMKLFDCE